MLWLLGCWQPPPVVPPAPAQVEASDVLEGSAAEIQPGAAGEEAAPEGEGAAEGEAAPEEEGAPEGEAEGEGEAAPEGEPAVAGPPAAVAVKPWSAKTVGSPITIVDDLGAAVQVIRGAPVAVVVLMEGEDRLRVRCDGCVPVVEGWLQKSAIAR